jgi:hypothetical protein
MAVKRIKFELEVDLGFDPFDIGTDKEKAQEFLAAAKYIGEHVSKVVGDRVNAVRIEKADVKMSPYAIFDDEE